MNVYVDIKIIGRKKNHEGERLLEFAVANELVVGNSWFKKKFENLVIYQIVKPKSTTYCIREVWEKWYLM